MRNGIGAEEFPKFIHPQFYQPLTDVLRVGRTKAVGYLALDRGGSEEIAPILKTLRQRRIGTYLIQPKSVRLYQRQAEALLQKLPMRKYCRRWIPSFFTGRARMPCLYAYDRRVLGELLLSNREMLRGYPASPRAVIELIYHVFFSAGDLHDLINLAFGGVRQGILYAGPSTWAWQQK